MLLTDVILPVPLDRLYTYSVPEEFHNIQPGCRVIVQFGKKKFYTAIAFHIYDSTNIPENIKPLESLLDKNPVVLPQQLKFWEWLSSYYICSIGEVYKAAVPSALKIESETNIIRNNLYETDEPLTPNEEKIYYTLQESKSVKISELQRKSDIKNIYPYIKTLAEKKAIFINEDLKNGYTAKTESYVSLSENFTDKELNSFIDGLSRSKKQQELLLFFLHLRNESEKTEDYSLSRKELLTNSGYSAQILNGLISRGILKVRNYETKRFDYGEGNIEKQNLLNYYQQQALNEINNEFKTKQIVLFHGITGSGKTEVYIQLINNTINKGKHALYLLPEIALTTQITERLKSIFGNKLLVYHSRFNDNERAEVWMNLLKNDEAKVILGARSAVFLPFNSLGLIIVDEEHESSYKQQDPAPRYNGRNAAIMLASIYNTKTLLGTATPSIETYTNALSGKFGLVNLDKRHENIELPSIIPVNTYELKRKKQMKSILSPPLIDRINEALSRKEQIILFQNRRGFAPLMECKTCSWTPVCENCDVSLTYHKNQRKNVCHYCGAVYAIPPECPNCQTQSLDILGYGTERIEEEVKELFPDARIRRMDLDTTRSKKAFEKIIHSLEHKETDILIGTQMVTKGLDFANVSVVGILNADTSLNYPDFRAHEKTYQLLTQVSGRAGRKNKQGEVYLQTSDPQHPVIKHVVNNNYYGLYNLQIEERKLFRYPPFYRLINIVLKSKDEKRLETVSKNFASGLRHSLGERVLGPSKPSVSRVQTLYIRHILLKIENNASPPKVRQALKYLQENFHSQPENRGVIAYFDVDPLA